MKNILISFLSIIVIGYTQLAYASSTFCNSIEGASLYSDDDKFLGNIESEFGLESIFNKYSNYGNKYNILSIFNEFGFYGNQYSLYSPWNQYSIAGPKIIKNNLNYGVLTLNKYMVNAVNPFFVISCFSDLKDERFEPFLKLNTEDVIKEPLIVPIKVKSNTSPVISLPKATPIIPQNKCPSNSSYNNSSNLCSCNEGFEISRDVKSCVKKGTNNKYCTKKWTETIYQYKGDLCVCPKGNSWNPKTYCWKRK